MIDVVYILGTGSKWQNMELRYSLRSLEKHLTWYRNVYVVGEDPGFLSDKVIHVPMSDRGRWKTERILNKILSMCDHPDVTDDFLIMNDDIFFLENLRADRVPYYYENRIGEFYKRPGGYKTALDNTAAVLHTIGLPTKYFDVHVPIIYNKDRFRRVMDRFDWSRPEGYLIHSLYCNYQRIPGEPCTDMKIAVPMDFYQLAAQLDRRPMFSIDDAAINDAMRGFLHYHFPDPSIFEKP